MSHGGGADKAEPNLVPLLDMVLQLVMFFMLCANFVMEQINETIKLPKATMAKSLTRDEKNLVYLNVDKDGRVLRTGDSSLITPNEIERYLANKFKNDERFNGKDFAKATLVIIRAHQDADFKDVFKVLKACKVAGYERVQLRAIQAAGST